VGASAAAPLRARPLVGAALLSSLTSEHTARGPPQGRFTAPSWSGEGSLSFKCWFPALHIFVGDSLDAGAGFLRSRIAQSLLEARSDRFDTVICLQPLKTLLATEAAVFCSTEGRFDTSC